jgi:hypothetical protein
MSWFFKSSAVAEPERVVDRVTESHADLVLAKRVFDEVCQLKNAFIRRYSVMENRFHQIAHCHVPHGSSRAELNAQWGALWARITTAKTRFDNAQKVWAEEKVKVAGGRL